MKKTHLLPAFIGAAVLAAPAIVRADLWMHVDTQGAIYFSAQSMGVPGQFHVKGASMEQLAQVQDASARLRQLNSQAPLPPGMDRISQTARYQAVQSHMQDVARRYAVDYNLLKAVAAAESSFYSGAVSPVGAVGLMQVMPATARQYGVHAADSLAEPRTNIEVGARHLRYLLQRFDGQPALAIAAYNAGEGAVRRAGNRVPAYRETVGYVQKVMSLYGAWRPAPESFSASVSALSAHAPGAPDWLRLAPPAAPRPAPVQDAAADTPPACTFISRCISAHVCVGRRPVCREG